MKYSKSYLTEKFKRIKSDYEFLMAYDGNKNYVDLPESKAGNVRANINDAYLSIKRELGI
jgi:hypothetical protein